MISEAKTQQQRAITQYKGLLVLHRSLRHPLSHFDNAAKYNGPENLGLASGPFTRSIFHHAQKCAKGGPARAGPSSGSKFAIVQ